MENLLQVNKTAKYQFTISACFPFQSPPLKMLNF